MVFSEIKISKVYRVLFFLRQQKHRKIFIFTGICKNLAKRSCSFTLENYYGSELLEINFLYESPYIIWMEELRSYNFFSKIKKQRQHVPIKVSSLYDLLTYVPLLVEGLDAYNFLYASNTKMWERRRIRYKFRI